MEIVEVEERYADNVEFQEIDTFDRTIFLEWGISDAMFIDGKKVRTGPPPSYEKIRKKIAKRIKKLNNKGAHCSWLTPILYSLKI